ncbi:MAG: alkaline phosphatase family protein [Bdellovibrio sp.]|nr:alkaline phosphatase family protein [Bdellovibrio sp.]
MNDFLRRTLMRKVTFLSVALLVLGLFACQHGLGQKSQVSSLPQNQPQWFDAPYVVLVSIDGMRHDYVERYKASHLLELKKSGLSAQAFTPVFPSITFPNHYSIITGLYPKNHRLIANDFYDRTSQERYQIKDRSKVQDGKWYSGLPLWLLANRQGMLSASYFWVGSDANIHGEFPNYYKVYDTQVPHDVRVAQILEWLRLPQKHRPHFLTLYYSVVDSAGHEFGPESKEVATAVAEVNRSIGELIQGLSALEKEGVATNLIIVSDHGMQKIQAKKLVAIPKQLMTDDFIITGRGAFTMIYTKSPEKTQEAIALLKGVPYVKAYKRQEAPKNWHMDSELVGDVIVVAQPGAYLTASIGKDRKQSAGGTHGYDPAVSKEMGGIFIARGPQIKNGKLGAFPNINLYPFVAALLGLKQTEKIDGKIGILEPYLIKK